MKRWLLTRRGHRQRYDFKGDPGDRGYRYNRFTQAWAKHAHAEPGAHGRVEVSLVLGGSRKSPGYTRVTFTATPKEAARIRRDKLPRGVQWMKLRGLEVRKSHATSTGIVNVDVSTRGKRRTKLADEVEAAVRGQLQLPRKTRESDDPDIYDDYWQDFHDAEDHDT